MTSSRDLVSHSLAQRLHWASVLCGEAALVILVLGWCGLILVLGAFIPPPWLVGVVLSAVSVILGLVHRHLVVGKDDRETSPGGRRVAPVWRAVTPLAVGGCVVAFLGDAAFGATYTVLDPSASDGCRAVARESSFLMSGGGQVYSVHPIGVGWRTGSWTADDGIRPIDNEQYEMSWGLGGGALLVHGDGHNPVYLSLHEVACD
jgi:hypothetical protein